jgi:hypothetical protein
VGAAIADRGLREVVAQPAPGAEHVIRFGRESLFTPGHRFLAAGDGAAIGVRLPRRAVRLVLRIVARDAAGNETVKRLSLRLVR